MKKLTSDIINSKTSIIFATFSHWHEGNRMPTNGSLEPLRNYLTNRINELILIDQPVPGSDSPAIRLEFYKKNEITKIEYQNSLCYKLLYPFLILQNNNGTKISFKIRDFLSIISLIIFKVDKYDYAICLESINTVSAILLRKLGKIDKVIYYVSDYSPKRYKNKLFNYIYLLLDRYCAVNADYIWDVSKAIQISRINAGLNIKKSTKLIHVPNGIYPNQINIKKIEDIKLHDLVYMGTLGSENGPDLAIKAVSLLKVKYPNILLHIIGGSKKNFEWLNPIIVENKLEKHIKFHGFILNFEVMSEIMSKCSIGLAPYRSIEGSARWYGDAGKIRSYCAAGLAVVSSQVPPLGLELAENGGAIIANDNVTDFTNAISLLFDDVNIFNKTRNSAITFIKENTWDNQFTHAFNQMDE